MTSIVKRLSAYLESLRFPWLLLITLMLFVVSVVVPDGLPLVDELLLALIALLIGRLKRAGKKPSDHRNRDTQSTRG